MFKNKLDKYTNIIFISPALLIYLFIVVSSVVYGFYISLTDWGGIRKEINFVGFQNYIEILKDPRFYNALLNTAYFTLTYTVLHTVFGFLLAKFFLKNTKINNFSKVVIFTPFIMSILSIAYIWKYIYTPIDGILNNILMSVGILNEPASWIGNEKLALWACVFTMLWYAMGFTFVIYIAGLKGIPNVYYEAAEIDGATWWKKLVYIDLPLLKPIIFIVPIIDIITSFKLFDIFYIMTKGGPGYSTETITIMVFREAFTNTRMAYATAISFILFTLVFVFTCAYLYLINRAERQK